jgi:Tol biopolymer transport system component
MGQVFKARDTRLNRIVAVKILSERFAEDPERKQRFEREAQAIASLNHPNICVVHDVGEEAGTSYLVMEYLEAGSLAQRLEKGPLPLAQALKCAIEIADALDKAHRHGIIHRDLKPANIMLTKSGAKLLDFGLAKLRTSAVQSASSLPTEGGTNLTEQGSILGTLQYMAPEQIEGEEADARSDIFAFGAVLYEMVTGKKAFKGKSQASLIASILDHDPVPMLALQPMAPATLDHVVQLCLAKEPENRWQTAHDIELQLKWIAEGGAQVGVAETVVSKRKIRKRAAWAICGVLAIGLIAVLITYFKRVPPETKAIEFSISPPNGAAFSSAPGFASIAPFPVISPDGQHVAFVAGAAIQQRRIWVRSMDSSEARVLAGTDGADLPFWSPDSQKIGFFAGGKVNTIDYSGGPVQVLSDAPSPLGGTWNTDGVILFAPNSGRDGLHRVSSAGGQSTVITTPGPESGVGAHSWPYFLPDGKHFLYLAQDYTSYAGSLLSKETKRLLSAESRAVYASPGFLLFIRQGTLMGQPFNAGALQVNGEPFRIAENVRSNSSAFGGAAFSVSDSGALTYRSGSNAGPRVVWFDRSGKQLEPINQSGDSAAPRLSPDETRIAVERRDGGQSDIWIIDLARGTNSRMTFSPKNETEVIWSPDGSHVIYAVESAGKKSIYQRLATGSGNEELLFKSDLDSAPTDWSQDGRFVLFYSRRNPKTGNDLFVLPMVGERKPQPLIQTPFTDAAAQFSPDGKWVAYWSDESGTNQTYVQPFPQTGEKIQISVDGGSQPRWRSDGKELFFISLDARMLAVDVESASKFHAGLPKALFQIPGYSGAQAGGVGRYSVTRDGKRFLLPINADLEKSPITVVLNWTAKLKK